jgi:nicotinamide mononucleotide transporter
MVNFPRIHSPFTIYHSLNMNWIEITAIAFTLICVWLTVRQNIWCWLTGIIGNVFLIIIFAKDRLYADLFLQVIYIGLGFYGWWMWLYGGANKTELPVSQTSARTWLQLAAIAFFGTFILAFALREFARTMDLQPASFLLWDSSTTVACLVAQWMLTKKLLESWFVWIATNISYIFLYAMKERFLLCLLQIILISLSVMGFVNWLKSFRERQV